MKARYILITAMVLVLDHLTKYWVSATMDPHDTIEIVPGYFSLSYVLNSGVAFGLFADIQSHWKPYLLAAMAMVAVVVIVLYSRRMPTDRVLLQLALAVTMGGILGNFADRILHGNVVDFIELHLRDAFHWPTFNLADIAITTGIGMLLLDTLRHSNNSEDRDEAGAAGTQG